MGESALGWMSIRPGTHLLDTGFKFWLIPSPVQHGSIYPKELLQHPKSAHFSLQPFKGDGTSPSAHPHTCCCQHRFHCLHPSAWGCLQGASQDAQIGYRESVEVTLVCPGAMGCPPGRTQVSLLCSAHWSPWLFGMPWVKASLYLGSSHWVNKEANKVPAVLKHVADGDLFIPWLQSPHYLLSSF